MKNKFLLIVFFSAAFFARQVSAQTFCMPTTGSQMVTTSTGTFYDSGCGTLNYSNQENATMTICPPTATCMISLTFSSIALADNTDILRIYSGVGSAGPLLTTFAGPISATMLPMITSVDATGCLTAWFQTGSSGIQSGWVATIGCQTPTGISENQFSGSFISSSLENNSLSLNLSSSSSFTLNIFSPDGKKVSEKNYSLDAGQHQLTLPTENLRQGIYFCRVAGEGINKSIKFIIQ